MDTKTRPSGVLERLWCGETVEAEARRLKVDEERVIARSEEEAAKMARSIFLTIVKRALAGEVDAAVFLEERGFITLPTKADG